MPGPALWPERQDFRSDGDECLINQGAREVNHSVLEGDMCSEACEGRDGERGAWRVCSFW